MSDLESGFRLTDVVGLLRRRSAIMLGAAILGLLAGYFAFASAPPTYSATARVEIASIPDDPTVPGNPASDKIDLGTESDLVKSDAVGNAVRKELDLSDDNRSLFADLIVTTKEDSRVIALTVASDSAAGARDRVNAISKAYLAERAGAATKRYAGVVTRLDKQLDEARKALGEANDAFDATKPGSSARTQAQSAVQQATQAVNTLNTKRSAYTDFDPSSAGSLVKEAQLPSSVLSKKALGLGVGLFGLVLVAGLGVALLVDRRDSLGGGRRRVQALVPGANLRILPTATGRRASPAEIDAAIDRLAVELAGNGARGRASSVLVVGTRMEPPLALAEELASSLTYAGIPALFVLAGTAEREVRQAHVVSSFTDLITGPSITGPASLPDVAGAVASTSAPTVTWLRPRGSAEASGLLRRAVVEALITRAGREGFEAVVFVAPTPTRNAAAAALGQWVSKTAVIVEEDDSQSVEQAVSALKEADVTVSEVVWT
ncbi:hypothetical protein BH10ACT1_BH10ACT1_35820 [soil metagenome]